MYGYSFLLFLSLSLFDDEQEEFDKVWPVYLFLFIESAVCERKLRREQLEQELLLQQGTRFISNTRKRVLAKKRSIQRKISSSLGHGLRVCPFTSIFPFPRFPIHSIFLILGKPVLSSTLISSWTILNSQVAQPCRRFSASSNAYAKPDIQRWSLLLAVFTLVHGSSACTSNLFILNSMKICLVLASEESLYRGNTFPSGIPRIGK